MTTLIISRVKNVIGGYTFVVSCSILLVFGVGNFLRINKWVQVRWFRLASCVCVPNFHVLKTEISAYK